MFLKYNRRMSIYFAHSSSINYKELYDAIINSKELMRYDFILPHAQNSRGIPSHDIIKQSQLFMAEVSEPSTGMGIEIGRAEAAKIPIVIISKTGVKISTAFDFLQPKPVKLIYSTPKDMVEKISKYLNGIEH